MICNLDIECKDCPQEKNYTCPNIRPGKLIKAYRYRGNDYMLCEGTHGKKYDLWTNSSFHKDFWVIKSDDDKNNCKA